MNYILVYRTCNCIPFNFIRNDSMSICDIQRMDCYHPLKSLNFESFDHLFTSDGVCRCLQACSYIEYKVEVIILPVDGFHYSNLSTPETNLEFKFKDSEYFPLIRYQQFKTKDFLSYVGGLLGLFAGLCSK